MRDIEAVLLGRRLQGGPARSWNLGALWRIAWRDLRGSSTAALIILGCLTLGVATITGIGSLRASLTDTLERDARALLGGDLVIESTYRALPPEELEAIVPADARVAHTVTTNAIAFADNGRQVPVALKAVDGAYPLYGVVGSEPALPLAEALADQGALVEGHAAAGYRRRCLALAMAGSPSAVLTAVDQIGGFAGPVPQITATPDAQTSGPVPWSASTAWRWLILRRRLSPRPPRFPEASAGADQRRAAALAGNADRLAPSFARGRRGTARGRGRGRHRRRCPSAAAGAASPPFAASADTDVFPSPLQVLLLCCGGLLLGRRSAPHCCSPLLLPAG